MTQQPLLGQDLLIIEDSSHTDTPQSVELLWTSDEPNAENSTCQHNAQKRQTSMPPTGFAPTISASEGPQNHALDRTATGIGG